MKKPSGLADSPLFKSPKQSTGTPMSVHKQERAGARQSPDTATQPVTQLRKPLRNPPSTTRIPPHTEPSDERYSDRVPSSEAIEQMSFQHRKTHRARVCGDVPPAWKKQIEDMAYQLGVGRYELVMYIIGQFLGEVETDDASEGKGPE